MLQKLLALFLKSKGLPGVGFVATTISQEKMEVSAVRVGHRIMLKRSDYFQARMEGTKLSPSIGISKWFSVKWCPS